MALETKFRRGKFRIPEQEWMATNATLPIPTTTTTTIAIAGGLIPFGG